MSSEQFYSPSVAIVPMGFCYPGRGRSGDLPPRSECAALWHERLLNKMPHIELTLLIGQYAQRQYIGECGTLTEVVKLARRWLPQKMVLPHPSPRNNIWLKKNPWFEADILPLLHTRLSQLTLNQ
jgi:uracil-DNA glycosylase